MAGGVDRLRELLQGNEDAVQLVLAIREISHVWDDLVDQDRPVAPAQIHRAFWQAIVGLQLNPFFQAHAPTLLPILETGIMNFVASCELERNPGHPRQLAHTARYQAGDVVLVIARIVGGADWAMQVAAQLKLLLHTDRYEDFDKEMEQRYGQAPHSPAA
jgi:hypothetical protein